MSDADDDGRLTEVVRRAGRPPRWFHRLRRRDGRSTRPWWVTPADPIDRIYREQDRVLRNGHVRWAAVVQANTAMFGPGTDDCPVQVVYAPAGDVPLADLRAAAARAFALKGTQPVDPAERRLADMLTDEKERAFGWPVPPRVAGGRGLVTTIVVPPRRHLPGGVLALMRFPVLVDPATPVALLVPAAYWPYDLRREWLAHVYAATNAQDAHPYLSFTPAAAARACAAGAELGGGPFWVRVGVTRGLQFAFSYDLDVVPEPPDPGAYSVFTMHGVRVALQRSARPFLEGTVVDHRSGDGCGFVFRNPNAQ
ncbi:MAG TPA: hypothetical protein VF796_18765 [Humisphaera sp.]